MLTVSCLRQLLAHLPDDAEVCYGGAPVEAVYLTSVTEGDVIVVSFDEDWLCDENEEVERPFGIDLSPGVRCYRLPDFDAGRAKEA